MSGYAEFCHVACVQHIRCTNHRDRMCSCYVFAVLCPHSNNWRVNALLLIVAVYRFEIVSQCFGQMADDVKTKQPKTGHRSEKVQKFIVSIANASEAQVQIEPSLLRCLSAIAALCLPAPLKKIICQYAWKPSNPPFYSFYLISV